MDTFQGTFLKQKNLAERLSSQFGHTGCHRHFFPHFWSLKAAHQSISCYMMEGNLGRQSRCSKGCWPHRNQKQFFLLLLCSDHDRYLRLEGITKGDKCTVTRKKNWFHINLVFTSPRKSFPNHFSLSPCKSIIVCAPKPIAAKLSAESLKRHLSSLWALTSKSPSRRSYCWGRWFGGWTVYNGP